MTSVSKSPIGHTPKGCTTASTAPHASILIMCNHSALPIRYVHTSQKKKPGHIGAVCHVAKFLVTLRHNFNIAHSTTTYTLTKTVKASDFIDTRTRV